MTSTRSANCREGLDMTLKCLFGKHLWVGCICSGCQRIRAEGHDWSADCEKCKNCGTKQASKHTWIGCRCSTCGRTRDQEHSWLTDCEKCGVCGRQRAKIHKWTGCKCVECGRVREDEHDWSGDLLKCGRCGRRRTAETAITQFISVFSYETREYPSEKTRAADAAAKMLARMGTNAIVPLIAALNCRHSNHAVDALSKIGSPAVEPLIAVLSHVDKNIRGEAARALGYIGDARALVGLITALEDAEYSVRNNAVWALGRLRDTRACALLLKILDKSDGFSRSEVVEALGWAGDSRAVEPLIGQLRRGDCVRVAAEALGRLGDTRAVEPLLGVLCDEKEGWTAIGPLGQLGDARAIGPLVSLLDTKNKYGAACALLTLGDSRGLEVLMASLDNSNPWSAPVKTLDKFKEYGIAYGEPLVQFLLGKLKSSQSAGVRRYSAEMLLHQGVPLPKRQLTIIILDWLEFRGGIKTEVDDGLKELAARADMGEDVLSLASEALGYKCKVRHERSGGGNYNSRSLESYDGGMSAVEKLCERQDMWSTQILYRVGKRKDAIVKMSGCFSEYDKTLSFERERQAAREELIRRGVGDIDPIIQLEK